MLGVCLVLSVRLVGGVWLDVFNVLLVAVWGIVSVIVEVCCVMAGKVPSVISDDVWHKSRSSLTWVLSLLLGNSLLKLSLVLQVDGRLLNQAVWGHLVSSWFECLGIPLLLMHLVKVLMAPGMIVLGIWSDIGRRVSCWVGSSLHK